MSAGRPKLTKEYVASIFEYRDGKLYWLPRDVSHAENKSFNKRFSFKAAGHKVEGKYTNIRLNGKTCKAHRLIFLMFHGYTPAIIDHINQDKRDDRIENLRAATKSQNQANSSRSSGTSIYRGVCFFANKWMAQIRTKNKKIYLGLYANEEDAAREYNKAAIKYHGEFASLNIIATKIQDMGNE